MNFWNKFFPNKKEKAEKIKEEEQLLIDLERAKKEWNAARIRLDQVVEKEEIDYAIYAHEAAQKRYELLLRHVRKARNYPLQTLEDDNTGHSGNSNDINTQSEKEERTSEVFNEGALKEAAVEEGDDGSNGKSNELKNNHHNEVKENTGNSNDDSSVQKTKLIINPSRFHLVFDLNNKGHMKGEG